jgi:ribonuclease Z
MYLHFLGTSAGTPTKARNVSGLAVVEDSGKAWCLVDCGEGTQHRLLRTPLSLAELQAIFITHVHGDHCYGLPGLLASAGMAGRRKPLTVVAPAGIAEWLQATQRLTGLYQPFEVNCLAAESFGRWASDGAIVEATPLSHRVPSLAYAFTEARPEQRLNLDRLAADGIPRGPLWGALFHGADVEHQGRLLRSRDYLILPHPPRRIVVGGDNDTPELLRDACRGAQVLVHEATYTRDVAEKVGPEPGHSTAAAVAAFAESAGLPNLVLTHFSPRYQPVAGRGRCIEEIRAEAAERYRGRLYLAEDLARYHLERGGQLTRVTEAGDRGPLRQGRSDAPA